MVCVTVCVGVRVALVLRYVLMSVSKVCVGRLCQCLCGYLCWYFVLGVVSNVCVIVSVGPASISAT